MADTVKQEFKLFYCYAREDKSLRDELETHLSWLKRRYQLTNWHDREILPGEEWEKAIDTHLNTAHLILLLISPNFMASDYCYGNEMQRALDRHKAGTCRVVPILLRPTYWEDAPFSILNLLPTNAKSITLWQNRDEAFQDVVIEISRILKDLHPSPKTIEDWLKDGNDLYDLKRYEEALAAYEQAIHLDSSFARAYHGKGIVLDALKRYEEALAACEQAIRLDPNSAIVYTIKGDTLNDLKRYEEALAACEQAIHLDPNSAFAYTIKGITLNDLRRLEEALVAFNQAIYLDPNSGRAYANRGNTLNGLKRYEEALTACEQAIHLDPNFAYAYTTKGRILTKLKRTQEAEQAFGKARQLRFK